jgi:hypothetical protein
MAGLKLQDALLDDRFQLIGRIAAGPGEETWIGRDIRANGRTVLIRIRLSEGAATKSDHKALTEAEAAAASALSHPHLVAFLGHGLAKDETDREFSFLAYEYLAGGDLAALGRRRPAGRTGLHELARLLGQAGSALAYAHQAGVTHGRLRPAHLLLSPDERTIKIAGLGRTSANVIEELQIAGLQTDVYAAPPAENSESADAKIAGDVYAFAKICFSAIAGETPVHFVARPIDHLPAAVASEPWSGELLRILQRATTADHGERYDSVTAFCRELAALADEHKLAAVVDRKPSPEEKELVRKRAELSPFEAVLAQRELELATLKVEMREFEGRYLRLVGVKHAELDELEAQIAEENARLFPDDVELRIAAQRARTRAGQSAAAAERTAGQGEGCGVFEPSEKIKKLYRELARLIHPDTVLNVEQKERRHVLMAQANDAYEKDDFGKLQNMLGDWEHSPESVKGHGPGAELIRTIRKIDQAEERLGLIAGEFVEWERASVFQLKEETDRAITEGRDHLHEMAVRIDYRIREARRRLIELGREQVVS